MYSVKALLVLSLALLALAQVEHPPIVDVPIEPIGDILPIHFVSLNAEDLPKTGPPHNVLDNLPPEAMAALGFPHIFDNDGVVNPPSKYQRYRGDEWRLNEKSPFFQWWYFNLADYENNRYYLITYTTLKTPLNASTNVFVMSVGYVDSNTKERWTKAELWSLSNLKITGDFDLKVTDDFGDVMFGLHVVNDNQYRIYGKMTHPDHAVNETIPKDTPIEWDLTLDRINGWYGQQDLETWMKLSSGSISWNPYTHNSLVQGTFTAGTNVSTYDHTKRYRAYGDMNWGNQFPSGGSIETAQQYPWGWYTVNVPNDDPKKDTAIVVGVGAVKSKDYLGRTWAGFGDFIIEGVHIGVRKVMIWDGVTLMSKTNDGTLSTLASFPYDFQNFTASNGKNYSVPLKQVLIIETTHYSIFLDFTATPDIINRLVFLDGNVFFSDFEALGCKVRVIIDSIDKYGNRKNLYNFISESGGLEYGYQTQD